MHVRVLTYNIHKCIGMLDRRYDPQRIVDTIRYHQPDIALLQEVAQGAKRYRNDAQIELLAEHASFEFREYHINVKLPLRGEYGNAILTRFPIETAENIDLTVPPKKARSALYAHLSVPRPDGSTQPLHVFNVHLGLAGIERRMQLRRVLTGPHLEAIGADTPTLIAGDFNDVWQVAGKRLLHPAGFRGNETPIPTFPASAPLRALDAIYTRGNVETHKVYSSPLDLARYASDHLPLVADLEIGGGAG